MVIKNCLWCKKEFKTQESRIKVGGGKFCSWSCYKNGKKGVKTGYSFWTGKKRDKATLIKMSANRKGKCLGETNSEWKGDEVGYHGLHKWVYRKLGKPTKCEHCKKDGLTGIKIHWANKSHEYKRDLTDWIRLCHSCHEKYDYLTKSTKLRNRIKS